MTPREAPAATPDLLEVRDLTIAYATPDRTITAVADVTLRLRPGEVVGIVGESGAGKSTLAGALLGLIAPPGRIVGGEVRLAGRPLPLGDEDALRRLRGRRIGLVVQDTLAALDPLCNVEVHLTETIRAHLPVGRAEAEARALDALRQVGMPEPELRLRHYPHQLSGGMRQRLVVALALAPGPDVLVADEPTTNLDAPRKRRILDLLTASCRGRGMGLILVSHDVGLVGAVADRLSVMRAGRIVESGPSADVLAEPRHPYTRLLLAAVPETHRRRPPGTGAPPAVRRPVATRGRAWLLREESPACVGPLLELRDVTVAFTLRRAWLASRRRSQRAVDSVSLAVAAGEVMGLVGESGSGKSTLARVAAGLLRPSSGRTILAGVDLRAALRGPGGLRVRREIQMVFQDPYASLNGRWRVHDILAEPLRIHRLVADRSEERAVVEGLLAIVDLEADAMQRWPHQFSAGQRQRIAIARALAARPRVLICDEPTSALDVVSQETVLRLLGELGRELRLTILLISHDLAVIRQTCDRVAVMRAGRLCEIAATEDIFLRPGHPYTRELVSLLPADLPGIGVADSARG